MIGAMPALAVRDGRRRQERRTKRPSMLFLHSFRSHSASPSPVQSPPGPPPPLEIYLIGKFSLLHVAVVGILMGAVTLFVGLVQLKPGAGAAEYRFILIGSGSAILLFGFTVSVIRCCLLPLVAKRRDRLIEQAEAERRRKLMNIVREPTHMSRKDESGYTEHNTTIPITTITGNKSPLIDPQFSPTIKN